MYISEFLGGEPNSVFNIIAIIALIFTPPVTFFILRRYRISVLRFMGMGIPGKFHDKTDDGVPEKPSTNRQLKFDIINQNTNLKSSLSSKAILSNIFNLNLKFSIVYMLSGMVHAVIATFIYRQIHPLDSSLRQLAVMFIIFSWPTVLTLVLVSISNRYFKILGPLIYLLFVLLIQPDLILAWALIMGIPTVFLILFSNKKIRTVGPFVLVSLIIFISGIVAAFLLIYWTSVLLNFEKLIQHSIWAFSLLVITLFVFGFFGYRILKWLATRYRDKKLSDHIILLDSWWLLFTITEIMFFSVEGKMFSLSGLLAFAGYKVTTFIGFQLITPKLEQAAKFRLLLLRVFGFRKRSERFLDELGMNWRYIGCVNLFISTDLATATLEPHEFLDFISGRLNQRFIKSEADLSMRIENMDIYRDPDGRFRINDFYCYENAWRPALDQLILKNDAILMDLRGFNHRFKGCIYELKQLINMVSLDKIVLAIDNSTDMPFLNETIHHLWMTMDHSSPNRKNSAPARIKLLHVQNQDYKQVRTMLLLLFDAMKHNN